MGQAQGHELPYDVGEKFTCLSSKSIWSVHSGKTKVRTCESSICYEFLSVFTVCDIMFI